MTGNERKIKRRIQAIVASSMFIFFCLILALGVQLAIVANQSAMKKSLAAQQQALEQQLVEGQQKIDYYQSSQFIDEYALQQLGYGRDGAKIFQNG